MDIIDRLSIEARKEPHEPIWRDAIAEIARLRAAQAPIPKSNMEKKVAQLKASGHVECGVMLKRDEYTVATVNEHGRVQWWDLGENGELRIPGA